MSTIQEIINQDKRIIGIWGYPAPDIIDEIREKYPDHRFFDLDVNIDAPSSNIVPDAYCKIIANIIDNAVNLKEKTDLIIASVGEEKCDSARIAAKILEDKGFNILRTEYDTYKKDASPIPISISDLPLKEKVIKIMDGVIEPVKFKTEQSKATMGFWGVPPNDMSLLELFPDTTHIFGWTRCVEAKRPADLDLEMMVDESVPTVFFAQTFCAKMQLAVYLARKYNGLYVDVDDIASNSVRAKIEAFIRLG